MKGFLFLRPKVASLLESLSSGKQPAGEADRQNIPVTDAKQDISNKPKQGWQEAPRRDKSAASLNCSYRAASMTHQDETA